MSIPLIEIFPTSISILFEFIASLVGKTPNTLTSDILFSLLFIIFFVILTFFVSVATGNSPFTVPSLLTTSIPYSEIWFVVITPAYETMLISFEIAPIFAPLP